MKLLAATVLISALPSLALAWTFADGYGHTFEGQGNKGCTKQDTKAGQTFKWVRNHWAFGGYCCIHLYETASCGSEVGYACEDWTKKSSKTVKSFKVDTC